VWLEWVQENQQSLWWVAGSSTALFVGTLLVMPFVVARMPADYFAVNRPPGGTYRQRHPAIGLSVVFLKNVVGAVFVFTGVLMLVLPGPGVITILVGLTLLDFPGKRALELRIAGQRHVLLAINWMRKRADRPPLIVPER